MKAKDLIEVLSKNPEAEVCIFDYLKHLNRYRDEPNGDGIIKDFQVDFITIQDYDEFGNPPNESGFISIMFKNDDYSETGEKKSLYE